jgi:LL-H family phage holin
MEFINMFISEYGTQILYAVLVAVFGYLGVQAKILADKYINDKIKKDVAKTVVKAVEQIYKDLHGEEKLNKALESASEMLATKGITITDLEIKMLIEAAVAEFNKAFEKTESK